MEKKAAVIQYPGSNCEYETARALREVGIYAEIFRWNRSVDELDEFDAYVIGGGFSYQDRVRAGVIAAKEPIMGKVMEEAEKGKPVLGICNGAQVLVESGMIPGNNFGEVEMALATNIMKRKGRIVRRGYYCDWVYLLSSSKKARCAFNLGIEKGEILPMPMAHAEGRFTTTKKGLLDELIANDQIVFRYSNEDGDVIDEFPVNPNGSLSNIAAVCNPKGNVMAIMPHPERAFHPWQTPYFVEKKGMGRKLFESLAAFLKGDRDGAL
ncbi:MAG: phosphoribosylformylglycinamidine synthase I [Candidatus Micrarchaeia archaeon]